MVPQRRPSLRPYAFELAVIANLAIIAAIGPTVRQAVFASLPMVYSFMKSMTVFIASGMAARLLLGLWRGSARAYLRQVTTAGWLTDTLRFVLFGALVTFTYAWLKLLIPFLNPRLLDQEMWDLDQALFFGYSPNVFLLNLFSHDTVLRAIDGTYGPIFIGGLVLGSAFFLSSPSRRVRVAFATGSAALWLMGVWLYIALPALGPALRFPEIWQPFASSLPTAQMYQTLLMKNYHSVISTPGTYGTDIVLLYGVAAFPSLHVGYQTFIFLWMRRMWLSGQVLFGILTLVILIGSVVTGWHYLIDGYAGIVLALVAQGLPSRLWKMPRWLRLARAFRRAAAR